ncbi:YSIRK-type signal peptide-containing protein [Gemella haemolysans]|uniref:YSIRK-type signal peptide-containing protein n=1 Tax=Gemella haemolysans TaxID=1379 RepID=A0AAW6B3I6_9BACL|nr:YSIRK-type signal peptide-containing protein [Gemella haemolysans]MDB6186329.1 YSIRK-type signal peptide-containing protein [Gemella haemolysans]
MVGKNNKYLKTTKEGTKVESYSIKKFKVGTASVVIGASIFLGAGAVSQAAEEVSNNTTADNTTNAGAKEETPKAQAQPAKVENTKESVAAAVAEKVEAPKTEAKAEAKAADKTALKASIENLEQKLAAAKNADEVALKTAREELAKAKEVFAKANATQDEVNTKVTTLNVLTSVVAESEATGTAAKDEAKKAEEKAKSEAKESKEVKEAKKELTQVTSEAEVTNVLAKEAIRKNEVKIEAKPAVEKAVAKNEEVIKVANNLLGSDNVTKEQIARSLEELSNSIKAVYAELENAGVRRDGRYGVALSANEGYTASSTELRKENGEFLGSTGKSYKVLDGNANYKVYVHGYQSENTDVPATNNGQAGTSGRTDIPLSKTEAQKLGREAILWNGKIRVTGKANKDKIISTYGAGGAYEYLTTEIYGYTYEQGNHYVYLTDVKKRFSLSPEATAAGYTITKVDMSNLPPGLAYNADKDTVEGYVSSTLQNGVYDMRYILTIEKGGATQQVGFKDLTAGWIGWQDSSAPVIQGKSKLVTIGDQVNHNIKYVDNDGMSRDERAGYVYRKNGEKVVAGSKTAPGGATGATFTAVDGSKVNTENGPQTVTAHTALNGNYTGSQTSINDVVPGLNYNPQTGDITGTASEAGIFTAAVYAKDYNNTTNAKNQDWNMYGQEAHENITIAVAPKITVSNVEAYATKVPVTISNGANTAEITMPDGTVTKLAVKDGNWTVAAGTTNTAVNEGDVLGAASTTAPSKFNLPVTSDATQYVGVDSIAAKATTDKVKANIQREFAMVNDAAGNTYKAVFNSATGKYSLPTEKAYELKDNGNGTSTLIERRVYTDAQANGDVKFVVYEFERTWNTTSSAATLVDKIAEIRKNGEVTAVGNVTRTETLVKKDNTSSEQGMVVTVSYDSVTNQWTSSDGTAVTAKKSNAGWEVETASGFKGYVAYREASSTDVASIQNAKPTGTSTSYSEAKDASVDLLKSEKANVDFTDTIDDKSDDAQSETIKTKLTVTAPDGSQKVFDAAKAEETAYIQAQRTAAAKTQAAATAVKEQQESQNELARLQELLDRSTRTVEDAQSALDNLKLRTISPTAQELAERKLAHAKEFKASIEAQLATAQANLSTKNTEVESARTAALEAEKAVETAREALKTAAAANLANPEIAAYTLGQYGSYKVTVRAVDSNGVVTTPTVGGTDSGEVTEDAVAETTYYIVVPKPEISSGAQDTPQSDTMEKGFKTGLPENSTVSDYKLVDPTTGNKVSSVTTDEGTYTVNPTTGEVSFTPAQGYVGTAKPISVAANVTIPGEDGNPVTVEASTTYTPTVYGVKGNADTTKDIQGAVQTSKPGIERFSKLNTPENTPDGTNVDLTTAKYSLEGADNEGKVVVPNEGTYTIDPTTGVVTFTPLPTFTGTAQGVDVKVTANATDKEGNTVEVTATGKYTPVVEPASPTAEAATSTDVQGATQEQPVTFNDSKTTIDGVEKKVPIDPTTYTLLDENGQPASEVPAKDATGKVVGTYTVKNVDGKAVAVFTPTDKTYVGKVEPVTVQAKDKNGTPVTTTYTPNITPVTPTGTPATSEGIQGSPQEGTPTFTQGHPVAPIKIDATQPAKLVDPTTGKPTDEPTIPAKDSTGKQVGTYTIDPTSGKVTFTPNKDFVGTPVPATVEVKDANGTPATATYTPTVKPVTPIGKVAFTEDIQGATQSGKPAFEGGKTTVNGKEETVPMDDTVPATFEDGNTTKTIKGEGTYTVAPDGTVTFVPEKTFTGKGTTLTVIRKDKNGTPARGEYTAVVHPVTPTGWDVISADIQGQKQHGKPKFKGGTVEIGGEEKTVEIDENVAPVLLDPATKQPVPVGTTVKVEGEGEYTLKQDGTVDFVPEKTFVGEAKGVIVQRVDKLGQPAIGKYRPIVIGAKPKAQPATSQDVQGQVQKQPVTFIDSVVDKTTVPDIDHPDVKVAVQKTVPINPQSYTLLDENGQPATKVPAKDPEGNVIGEYTLEVVDGKAIGVLTPNATYHGKVQPVRVQAADENGITVETTYTPYITPVTPTATPVTSEGIQGKSQEGTPTFKEGDKKVPINLDKAPKLVDPTTGKPTDATSVKVPNEGTYEIDENGKVTFTPEPNFTGEAKGIEVQREDKNGTPVNGKYTPFVKPVTPKGDEKETQDIQGAPQKSTPTFTGGKTTVNGKEETVEIDTTKPAKLVDPTTGQPTEEKTVKVPGEGTYTIDPKTGEVTFTPEPQFKGKTSGIKVQRVDKNGTPAESTYTPTVLGVTPKGKEAKSKDLQGETQTGKPTFKGGKTTINGKEETVEINNDEPATFEDGSTTKVVPNEGTYTVAPDGTVTFVPEKTFTGVAKGVTVQRVDKNGTPVTAKYTPTVIPVSPSGEDVTSVGPKNTPQEETPVFKGGSETVNGKNKTVEIDKDVPATFEDGSTRKEVPGEGVYTVDKDGKVTFTPEKDFVGVTKGVTVKRVDKNGTPVTAKYTPTVLGATSTKDVVSEGPKGKPQSNTPVFEGDIDKDVPPTFEDGKTTKVVPGQGTYTIDPNGKVTFTPEPEFVGTASGVTVVRKDKNGKTIFASYTPTVRPDTIFRDKEGKEIPGYPSEDGTTPKKDIPGYRFVETVTDNDGNTKHVYEKVKTSFKDKEGKDIPGYPTEEGETPKKDIPGYRFVETKKLPNGDTEHVYEKVKTSFKDKEGKEIPNYPTEDGDQPKKDIPGYRFVETKKLPNGDTEHVYEKVKTSFKDKEGKEIPNYPTEDGEQPKKDIPGYRFVETKKLPNGDIEHVYEKVTPPAPTPTPVVEKTTSWVDENGNPLKPLENGTKVPGEISGYEFVRTVTDKDGNVRHIFKPVNRIPEESRTTNWVDENGNPLKPTEKGTKEAGKVPGYEFVRTEVDKEGNLVHIFRKVTDSVEKVQPKRLANTGESGVDTGLAGFGALLAGIAVAVRKRQRKDD